MYAMYNRQLETFLKVAETGSFSATASELYISASAVIQQINSLEAGMNVTLFERTRHGVTLTEPGRYLAAEAREYIRQGKRILSQVQYLQNRRDTICVGTSVFEKVHLLADFWLAFAQEGHSYDVRMVDMDHATGIAPEIELIESVKDGMQWQNDWNFIPVCDMPLYIGVDRHDLLSKKEVITAQDLRDRTVRCLRRVDARTEPLLSRDLMEKGIRVQWSTNYDRDLLWQCACHHHVLILPLFWKDLVPDIVPVPYETTYTMPYGFFSRKECTTPTANFLAFVRKSIADDRIRPI